MPPRARLMIGLIAAVAMGAVGTTVIAASPDTNASIGGRNRDADAPLAAPEEPSATPEARAARPRLAAPANPAGVKVAGARLFGWALMDRTTGAVAGSPNSHTVTNTVESMIKPWIAADHLRRLTEGGREPSAETLRELSLMIVDSNDPVAEKYYQIGGSDAVIRRLVAICGLKRVTIKSTLWSWTEMTPQDAVRYGDCLADGDGAGPRWTPWVLDVMRKVRGSVSDQISGEKQGGRWGIVDGLPPDLAREASIKNGWTLYKDGWHVNCLAVHPDWSLTVMLRITKGLRAGADACKAVAAALVTDP